MPHSNAINQLLADELTGVEKVKALFKAKGFTYQSFAQKHSLWPEQVKMTVSGLRPYPEIRDLLCEELGLTRAEIDVLIDGEEAEPAPEVA